jgi:hypothetical protein
MLTQDDASTIRQIVREEVSDQLKPVNKKLVKLQKDLDVTIKFFDRDIIKLRNDFDDHVIHLH